MRNIPRSVSKSAPPPSPSTSSKKRRFKGWVCDDELSAAEEAVLQKLNTHGQEFGAESRQARPSIQTHAPTAPVDNSRRAAHGNSKIKTYSRVKYASKPKPGSRTLPFSRLRPPNAPESNHRSASVIDEANNRKKKVRSWEVDEDNTDLANKIRQTGSTFTITKPVETTGQTIHLHIAEEDKSYFPVEEQLPPSPPQESSDQSKNRSSRVILDVKEAVKRAEKDAKNMQSKSDEAARAATVAKRQAKDATNRLEELKRQLRTEKEKEKAQAAGLKYHPGWTWVKTEGEIDEEEGAIGQDSGAFSGRMQAAPVNGLEHQVQGERRIDEDDWAEENSEDDEDFVAEDSAEENSDEQALGGDDSDEGEQEERKFPSLLKQIVFEPI